MTLLEVMIALAVLAMGLLAMLAMQISAMRGGKYGRHTTEAAQLARDQMEYLHRLDWGDAAVQPTGAHLLLGETDVVGEHRCTPSYSVAVVSARGIPTGDRSGRDPG